MGFGLGDLASFAAGGPLGLLVKKGTDSAGSSTVTQSALETPEQAEARKALLEFAKSGTIGNYTAGTPYTGSLGDFGISALETQAQGQVGQRLGTAGTGGNLALSDSVLADLLGSDKYNPLNPGGAYDSLTAGIDRNTREAAGAAKRSAAFGGSLYSTDTIRSLGDVQARGNETKATTMAGLYQNYLNQKLAGTGQAYSNAATGDSLQRGAISDAYTYGAVPRSLNTANDQAKYLEFQRQRGEQQGQVNALTSVSTTPSNFGVPSVSVPNDNPWAKVLDLLAQFGGKAAGEYAGGYGGAAGAKAGAYAGGYGGAAGAKAGA